ncbi:MAG: hypothetical protein QM790_05420 [Nibricoccus sp.]
MPTPPPLHSSLLSFAAIDEGLDRVIRVDPLRPQVEWTLPLPCKSRTLQRLSDGHLLAVTDTGYMEIDSDRGVVRRKVSRFPSGVISATRLPHGHTFLGGLNLGRTGVTFDELDANDEVVRSVAFPGDYVRRATLTSADTILFTCDHCVREGDWSGKIIRQFSAPGFKHAWKALRFGDDRTVITAGYGAFVAEFTGDGRLSQRWECTEYTTEIRPFFFGDMEMLPDGGLLVCNWLGHGTDRGSTGYSLLHFYPAGKLAGAWRDASRASSLQTFALMPQ